MMDETIVEENIFKALLNLQKNKLYVGQHENVINDGFRDMLSMVFECSDQTRQGISENELDSGMVDILIKHSGLPVSIIESVRLKGLEKESIIRHINKLLTKYDDNGCLLSNLVIYAMMADFSSFWDKLSSFLQNFDYPYEIVKPFVNIDTCLAESRHGIVILRRQSYDISFHIFAVHMRE